MTETAFRAFPDAVLVALFDEAPGGGDPKDINSLRNRPALDPEAWLANVYFHTSLDNMEVILDQVVTINHASFGAMADDGQNNGAVPEGYYGPAASLVTHDLVTFDDLGYEPFALVTIGDNALTPGYPVQVPAIVNGSGRYCCPVTTSTKVQLSEARVQCSVGLGAVSIDYRVMVFRRQRPPSTDKLIEFDPPTGGNVSMGLDRFNSLRRYLQVVPGGTPFGLTYGRSMDANNGAPRLVAPSGTIYDPVPSDATFRLVWGPDPGPSAPYTYGGTFTGDETILVQAP